MAYQEEFRTGKWAQTDYNFETPSSSWRSPSAARPLRNLRIHRRVSGASVGERLADPPAGADDTTIVFQGAGGCRYFSPGYQFTLQDHYRSDLNQAYLLTAVRKW